MIPSPMENPTSHVPIGCRSVENGNRHQDKNTLFYVQSRLVDWYSDQPLSYYMQFSIAHMTANTSDHTNTQGISFGGGMRSHFIDPFFLEVSVSPTFLTQQKLGGRHQPHGICFQDFFSLGVRVPNTDLDLRYSYVHYSNGGLWKPNLSFDFQYILSASMQLG